MTRGPNGTRRALGWVENKMGFFSVMAINGGCHRWKAWQRESEHERGATRNRFLGSVFAVVTNYTFGSSHRENYSAEQKVLISLNSLRCILQQSNPKKLHINSFNDSWTFFVKNSSHPLHLRGVSSTYYPVTFCQRYDKGVDEWYFKSSLLETRTIIFLY